MIIGNGGSGKTTFATALRDAGGPDFRDSSRFAGGRAVWPTLQHELGYQSYEECFADRSNHRERWGQLIADYCRDDPARLATEIYRSAQVYVGMRKYREFLSTVHLFNPVVIWIDRHVAVDPSNELRPTDAHIVLHNSGDLRDLERQAAVWASVTQLAAESPDVPRATPAAAI